MATQPQHIMCGYSTKIMTAKSENSPYSHITAYGAINATVHSADVIGNKDYCMEFMNRQIEGRSDNMCRCISLSALRLSKECIFKYYNIDLLR